MPCARLRQPPFRGGPARERAPRGESRRTFAGTKAAMAAALLRTSLRFTVRAGAYDQRNLSAEDQPTRLPFSSPSPRI